MGLVALFHRNEVMDEPHSLSFYSKKCIRSFLQINNQKQTIQDPVQVLFLNILSIFVQFSWLMNGVLTIIL